ncbi:NAD(P)-dependent oxidoreductase [Helicobacter canis]|uniref:NAD-dependent epimerase/dehydratase n=1 Tax=Helicobacter canis TaxID=29419 RepID=A0A377J6A4_9HELI|nr:NAD(P)-dependent oxidoreductase [Helicobacter canis]STO97356.1 NAD-dependent epimerase/dehydratase [Helicobacter canis]
MRYIVLGGSGFVGSYTIAALAESMANSRIQKAEIFCLDRVPNPALDAFSTFVPCDLLQGFDFALDSSDIIIHLAARAYAPKPPLKPFGLKALKQYFYEVNVAGTQALLTSMLESKASKLIYFSTDMVYGTPAYLPVDSRHKRTPFGYYGASKVQAEDLIVSAREQGINASIFRPRIIVGAGRYGILTKLFALISHSLPVPLIGDGSNCYQMISVQDCAQAIICAIEKSFPNNAYNLGSHNPPTIKALLSDLITQAGSKSLLIPTHAGSVKLALSVLETLGVPLMYKEQYAIADCQYIVDISSTQAELGWSPQYSDSDMLLAAYKQYLHTKP